MIDDTRVRCLRGGEPVRGDYVLYWMQASARASCNHALEYALERADEIGRPVVAYFGLTDAYPEANLRHYTFLLQGLRRARKELERRGILLIVRRESPEKGVVRMAGKAGLVVTDRGYTRVQRGWREAAAGAVRCPLFQVESDVIVPVEEVSGKEEYAAATLRPKLRKQLSRYLVPLEARRPRKDSLGLSLTTLSLDDPAALASSLGVDHTVPPVPQFIGGSDEAHRRLDDFLEERLDDYAERSRDPAVDGLSGLSPYLHFGHISPLEIALKVEKRGGAGAEAFLEELIIRRELSMNFVFYNSAYDRFQGLPEWARKTLCAHKRDRREYLYAGDQWKEGRTHDPYWNAAQMEMVRTGKMHGYMRMYWGKKILEWSETPEEAFMTALAINNAYELDGRDPNGFAGVAWCFGKHDRGWKERPVFGKVRYMNAAGLRRKFDMDAYLKRVERSAPQAHPEKHDGR